eukprot:9159267-Karenia_brevis.AAC.1
MAVETIIVPQVAITRLSRQEVLFHIYINCVPELLQGLSSPNAPLMYLQVSKTFNFGSAAAM